jgi:hypothetical protein
MKYASCLSMMLAMTTLIAASVGCASLTTGDAGKKKKKDASSWSLFKKKEYQVPKSMEVTWAHDVITLPGKPPTRGFGGRFYFYNEKSQAIPVDGDLVVYGFDDTHRQPGVRDELTQADKRFRFTAEQFTSHFSEGELGASYSVWIPWDEAYGDPKKIMLIPTFVTKDGQLIRGNSANLSLPGKANSENTPGLIRQASATIPTALPGQLTDARTQTASHQTPVTETATPSSGLRTTTIQVPSGMLRSNAATSSVNEVIQSFQNQPAFQDQFELQKRLLEGAQQPTTSTSPSSVPQTNSPAAGNVPVASDGSIPISASVNRPQLTTQPLMQPPTPMPLMRASMNSNHANGWVLPEFSQAPYSALTPRSAPSSLPAQGAQGVQQASYPSR